MSASVMVLDLMRAHYRGDQQAFRAFALRLARLTKVDSVRQTMLDVINAGASRQADTGQQRFSQLKPTNSAQQVSKSSESDSLEPIETVTLDDLLLLPELREQIDGIVLEIAHRVELQDRGLRPRCRLLFEGPPGNGKTSSGAAIANELGCEAYAVSIPSLLSKWVNETAGNLGRLFKSLDGGAIVVFDELDAIGAKRMNTETSAAAEYNKSVNSILTLLDRRTGGTLIATTNRADMLDPALVRRFDEIVSFPAPSGAQMAMLASRLEAKFGLKDPVDLTGCENFDAVTKRVMQRARTVAMAEILAAKAAQTEELPEEEDEDGEE